LPIVICKKFQYEETIFSLEYNQYNIYPKYKQYRYIVRASRNDGCSSTCNN